MIADRVVLRVLLPPSAGTGILARRYRPGARGAADGAVPLAVEVVLQLPMLVGLADKLFLAPVVCRPFWNSHAHIW